MKQPRDSRTPILLALGGFLAGAFTVAALVWNFGSMVGLQAGGHIDPAEARDESERWGTLDFAKALDVAPAVERGATEEMRMLPTIGVNPMPDLRARVLGVPVVGVLREDLRNSFKDARGSSRSHEAIDILAARETPVVAVEDGRIARLFFSKAGGITVYQFDPGEQYVYYYAHLQRYADGLKEGDAVRRGQVLGYVGTTGNAPPDTPHLHFAIYRLTDKKRWWEGTPIDPYDVLR